ncbi:MAG: hypothetical protein HGA90_03920 [Alphaproteobacteria bacterium]|nr:hypothetical protein [Alphaproteobacteria bacterium]
MKASIRHLFGLAAAAVLTFSAVGQEAHANIPSSVRGGKDAHKLQNKEFIRDALASSNRVLSHKNLPRYMEEVSRLTGISKEEILVKIHLESRGGESLKNPKSSARGIAQILDDTFIEMVAKYGPRWVENIERYTLRDGARLRQILAQIEFKGGKTVLKGKKARELPSSLKKRILVFRNNDFISLLFSVVAAQNNQKIISPNKLRGRDLATYRYISHLLGPYGARATYKNPAFSMARLVGGDVCCKAGIRPNMTGYEFIRQKEKKIAALRDVFRKEINGRRVAELYAAQRPKERPNLHRATLAQATRFPLAGQLIHH